MTGGTMLRMAASRVAVFLYVEPVVRVVLGMMVLGERLSWQVVGGDGAGGEEVRMV